MSIPGREEEAKENPEMIYPENQEKDDSYDEGSSPRGVLESAGSGTDSDNSGSSGYSSNSSEKPLAALGKDVSVVQWIDTFRKKSVRKFSSTIPLITASYELSRKSLRKKIMSRIRTTEESVVEIEGISVKPRWRNFVYAELAAATSGFKSENLIGQGGHAEVYRGCLQDGQVVAVKKLINYEKEDEQKANDFLSELGIIAHINHPNAVRLIGFGVDNGLYFVLQYAPNGSLASSLFGSECLPWNIRFKVALEVAEGLRYLHHDCQKRIIHRDIKASNILLNQNNEAEISDFGLAKWLPENWVHHVVFPIEGTFGYLSPEYFMHGIVDEKTDVFAFGVLLLEIITGRRAVDSSRQSLVIWANPLLVTNNAMALVDPRLRDSYDPAEMKRAMETASMCVHHMASKRPYMNQVVQILKGEERLDQEDQNSVTRLPMLVDACELEDYTSSNYLIDLDRHRQLLME